jgi:hypothetical protein
MMSLKKGLSGRFHDEDESVNVLCFFELKHIFQKFLFNSKDSIAKLSNVPSPLGIQVRLCRTNSLNICRKDLLSKSHSLPPNVNPLVSVCL